MCDPVTGAALAATAFGTYEKNQAAGQVQAARARTMMQAEQQQQQLKNQAYDGTLGTVAQFSPQNQQQQYDKAVADRTAAYQPNQAPGMGNMQTTDDANPVIANEMKQAIAGAQQRGQLDAQRLAKIGAHGDVQFGNMWNLNDNANNIGRLASFSQGQASAVPWELQADNYAGQGAQQLGDIAQGVGMMAGLYGATQPLAVGSGMSAAPVFDASTGALTMPAQYSGVSGGLGGMFRNYFSKRGIN